MARALDLREIVWALETMDPEREIAFLDLVDMHVVTAARDPLDGRDQELFDALEMEPDRFLPLPVPFPNDERHLMESFAASHADLLPDTSDVSEEGLRAFGLEHEYLAFRREHLRAIARAWAVHHDINS